MNNSLNDTYEQSFNKVLKLASDEQSYEQLIEMLNSEEIAVKHLAVLKLDKINSEEDAILLASKLVNQDGKVREAVSFRINTLVKNERYINCFRNKQVYDLLLYSITDINGNVCRNIISTIRYFLKNEDFCHYFAFGLMKNIKKIWSEIEQIDLTSMQYVVNKRNFQLYWELEALLLFVEYVDEDFLREIIQKCYDFYDYTIREKVAKILFKLDSKNIELKKIRQKMEQDENYFVRLSLCKN